MGTKRTLDTQTVLQAAAELAQEKGLENITLFEVAGKLGVKPPSLYNHVNGLKALSTGIAKYAMEKLEAAVRGAAVGRSKEDALKAVASAYRSFAKANPELYKAILRFPTYDDAGVREAGHAVVRVLYQVMEPYGLSEADNLQIIRGFRSALHGFVSLETAGFFQNAEASVDDSFDRLVSSLISTVIRKEDA